MAAPPPTAAFAKPGRTPADLLAHLIGRGLVIADRLAALQALERIGYYRLLIYMRALQTPGTKGFPSGTTFEHILDLYTFDRELRLLCLDAVERVEVALRAAIINALAVPFGPHFYEDPSHFVSAGWFSHTKLLDRLDECESLGIAHYKRTYATPARPPIWVVLEATSHGVLSRFFSGLTPANQRLVGGGFSLPAAVLVSWFRSLTDLRNVCAHHGRLWNAHLPINKPMAAHAYAAEFTQQDVPYARLVVLTVLLADVDPLHAIWRARVRDLFRRYPQVDAAAVGCPTGWESRAIWQ